MPPGKKRPLEAATLEIGSPAPACRLCRGAGCTTGYSKTDNGWRLITKPCACRKGGAR